MRLPISDQQQPISHRLAIIHP